MNYFDEFERYLEGQDRAERTVRRYLAYPRIFVKHFLSEAMNL